MEESEGNRQTADELMRKAADLAPEDAKLWFTWGLRRKKSQNLADAQAYLEKAVALDPQFFWSRFHLATVLSWKEDYEAALTHLEECERLQEVRDDPATYRPVLLAGQAESLRRWGDSLARGKNRDVEAALLKLKRALELSNELKQLRLGDPRSDMIDREVNDSLGTAYFYARDLTAARRHYDSALFRPPVLRKEQWHNAEVNYRFARLEQSDGNLPKALELVGHGLRFAREPNKTRLNSLKDELVSVMNTG